MKRFLFLFAPILFFLFVNIQPASAVTCCTNPLDQSTCFQVQRTCFSDSNCADNEKCDYGGAWCGWPFTSWPPALGGPCKPLDCTGCAVAQNHQCVSQPRPSSTPNCCSYSCVESQFQDNVCYSLTNIQTDVNNCGYCRNKCASGQTCENGICKDKTCTPCDSGTTPCGSCSSINPGKRCVDVGGVGQLQLDTTCKPYVPCSATFSLTSGTITSGNTCTITASVSGNCINKAFEIKKGSTFLCSGNTKADGTGSCPFSQSGVAVDSFDLYIDGSKMGTKSGSCGGGTGDGGGSAGGSSWYAPPPFNICSSGCPTSYPNQQYVACASIPGCNPGTGGCASYDPTQGQTPCCTAGGYYTCNKDEICTDGGCKSVCTGADKTSELYCSKCNSCQDGVQNCGEPSVDKCGQPCTVAQAQSYSTPGSYGGYTCSAIGNNKCQYYAPSGAYNIACVSLGGCSYSQYGCWWNCQATFNVFNTASCSDGFQNCAETCVDGGGKCITGKETDNSYLVTFDYTQPAGLSNTKLYTDAASWNCADGIDNDRDCLIDCAEPACSL